MDLSPTIEGLVKLFSPDGKSFDRDTFKKLAATFADTDAQLSAQLEAPTKTATQRLEESVAAAEAYEDLVDRSGKRVIAGTGELRNQADSSYQNRLNNFTNSQLQLLQPGYDSLSEGRRMHSADYGKLLEYRAGQENADRELKRDLINKRNVMGMVQTGVGGGLLLLDILKNR